MSCICRGRSGQIWQLSKQSTISTIRNHSAIHHHCTLSGVQLAATSARGQKMTALQVEQVDAILEAAVLTGGLSAPARDGRCCSLLCVCRQWRAQHVWLLEQRQLADWTHIFSSSVSCKQQAIVVALHFVLYPLTYSKGLLT